MNALQQTVLRKAGWRLVPILTLAYVVKLVGITSARARQNRMNGRSPHEP